MPAASAAPEPPLEPPGTRSVFQGLRHWPETGLTERIPKQSSCSVALPTITAPARRKRATTAASSFGTWFSKKVEPLVVLRPAVSMQSFTAMGMPCRRPSQRPSAVAASAASAVSRAASLATVTKAFSRPPSPSMVSSARSSAARAPPCVVIIFSPRVFATAPDGITRDAFRGKRTLRSVVSNSRRAVRPRQVPLGCRLIGDAGAQQQRLAPPGRFQLQPDRKPRRREATGHR